MQSGQQVLLAGGAGQVQAQLWQQAGLLAWPTFYQTLSEYDHSAVHFLFF